MDIKEIIKISANLTIIFLIGGLLIGGVFSLTSPVIFQAKKLEKEQALSRMLPVILKVTSKDREKIKAAMPEGATIANTTDGAEGTSTVEFVVDGTKLKPIMKAFKKAGAIEMVEETKFKPVKISDWYTSNHKHAEFFTVKEDGALKAYIVQTFGKGYSSYINILVSVDTDGKVIKMNVLAHGETPGLGDEILLDYFKDQFIGKTVEQMVVIKGETKENIQAITGATISTRAVTNGVKEALELIGNYESGEFKLHMDEKAAGGGH